MSSYQGLNILLPKQILEDFFAELNGGLSWFVENLTCVKRGYSPNGISPEQVIHEALVGRLLTASNLIDLVKGLETFWDATMHRQIVSINAGTKRQLIKHIHDSLVALLVIHGQHLVPEIVVLGHFSRLMISSQ